MKIKLILGVLGLVFAVLLFMAASPDPGVLNVPGVHFTGAGPGTNLTDTGTGLLYGGVPFTQPPSAVLTNLSNGILTVGKTNQWTMLSGTNSSGQVGVTVDGMALNLMTQEGINANGVHAANSVLVDTDLAGTTTCNKLVATSVIDSELITTNVLVGLGTSTNFLPATPSMITNSWGIFGGSGGTKFLSDDGVMHSVTGTGGYTNIIDPVFVDTSTGAVTIALSPVGWMTYFKSGMANPLYLTGNGATNTVNGSLVRVSASYIGTNWYVTY